MSNVNSCLGTYIHFNLISVQFTAGNTKYQVCAVRGILDNERSRPFNGLTEIVRVVKFTTDGTKRVLGRVCTRVFVTV